MHLVTYLRSGSKLYPSESVNFLGVKIDKHLTLKQHNNGISIKLNKTNVMLSKAKYFVDKKSLEVI